MKGKFGFLRNTAPIMHRLAWGVPVLLLILLVSNCTSSKTMHDIDDSEKLIWYERTPCFGYCPVYEVTILRNGQAFFVGHRFVPYADTAKFEVPARTLESVRAILRHPDYLDYELEEPEYHITDIPGLNFWDFTNDRMYELDQIIPPAVSKITELIDPILVAEELIYDPEIYPMIRQEVLLELKPGTDPYTLDGHETEYKLTYQDEVGAGIYKYEMICPEFDIDKVLTAIRQRKGVREVQLNHNLERREGD